MAFDELTSISDTYEYNVKALERTRLWAERSLREHVRLTNLRANKPYQALFGVLQGGRWQDLREKAARDLAAMTVDGAQFDGFGLGGAFEKERLGEILAYMTTILLPEKPRHLLGLARPDDIFTGVENGADTFDCVAPTREARHGRIYTLDGNISLRRAEFASDTRLLDAECACSTCTAQHTRAELRALLKSPNAAEKEQYFTLATAHNVYFTVHLVDEIRQSIIAGNYDDFKQAWLKRFY
jgi:queuine tRNA-ribosyltransferase